MQQRLRFADVLVGDVGESVVFSLMGGADVYVPEDLRVEISDINIT